MDAKKAIFVVSILISSIPAVMWPGITQRVLFMVVPGCVILACFFIKRYERYWPAFLPVLALYILSAYLMDSVLLDYVNLPI